MGKFSCCDKVWHKRGQWTSEEDQKLTAYIEQHGHGSWRDLPEKAGLQRCGKSCRLRWINYLRPGIKRGKFSLEEEQTIVRLHALLGNRWSVIANHLPRRTDNEIKNYWNTHLKKKLMKMGIDPVTHNPKRCRAASLSHMVQWETTRLEAESKLVCMSKVASEPPGHHFGSVPELLTHAAIIPPAKPHTQCLDILKAWQRVVSGMLLKASNFSENGNLLSTPTIGIGTANAELAASTSITCKTAGGSDWNCFDNTNEVMNNHYMTLREMTCASGDNEQLPDSFMPEEHEYYAPATTSMMEDSLDTSVREFDYWDTSMATERFYGSYGGDFKWS